MQYDRMLAELFEEEDRAREMATHLMNVARTSRTAAAAEKDSLVAFIRGPMERHMVHEERTIFPQLERRGLGAEVQVAGKHHAAIREDAERLSLAGPEDDVSALVFDIARRMLHHTNFEADYIYPELTHEDWRALMKQTVEQSP
jgi:DUF438 domain-containing protein